MNVESEATVARRPAAPAAIARPVTDWTSSPIVAEVLERLPDSSTRFVACAPGRLDVMGGLADYAGSLVLNMTTADHVCVAVQRRADHDLSIVCTRSSGRDDSKPAVIAMSQLCGPEGAAIDVQRGRELVDGSAADAPLCVLGALVETLRAKLVPRFDGGLSIVVGSTLNEPAEAGRDAALAAATLVAVGGAYDVTLDPLDVAAVCQRVENDWLCAPVGIADAVSALLGEPYALMELRCEPCTLAGSIRLPDDLVLLGIDSGLTRPDAKVRYERVRTAAFMGRALIDRIIQHQDGHDPHWDGVLARIPVTDYVEWFRDRIPTKLKGNEYLERFGETGDPLTRVDPDFVYKIRSRTEHHIYENDRACRFAECLLRAIRTATVSERQVDLCAALAEAGELMYASHWSYGQRCGLGSVETDLLVNLIRKHGADADIYGAKITARGCGGVVAVLLRAGDKATAAVNAVVEAYKSQTGRTATLVRGSSPGALVRNVQRM